MSNFFPIDAFGLPEHQVFSLNKEIERDFSRKPEDDLMSAPNMVEGRYVYKLFSLTTEISDSELEKAVNAFIILKNAENLVESDYDKPMEEITSLFQDMVDSVHKNDQESIDSICASMKKIVFKVLEKTSSVRTIIGLCKIVLTAISYLC